MRIAVYIDGQDDLVSLYEPGRFCIYEGSGSGWMKTGEIAFAVDDSTSLAAAKSALAAAVGQFGDCDLLLSGSVKGFLYSFLQEEFGFRIWKSAGPLTEQLAGVEQRERERAEQARKPPTACGPAAGGCASGGCGGGRARRAVAALPCAPVNDASLVPEDLGDGRYRIDLIAALSGDARLNSRQILLPILEGSAFERLEILCDHLPKWLAPKLQELNLQADCAPLQAGNGIRAIVSHHRSCG